MFRILAIGNSFSTDATQYLHQIGSAAGIDNEVVNLYIGGCPLERHWRNIEGNRREYQLQINGIKTDRFVSVQDMLDEKQFDVIVTHQASGDSGWENTYEPFLGLMLDYLREKSPNSKLFLNETWAYEAGSPHEHFMRYNRDQQVMLARLRKAYGDAAKRHGLPLIRSGDLIQRLRETEYFSNGQRCITRDGFHLNYLYGRYAVALLWAKEIMGVDVPGNDFTPVVDFMPFEKADREIIAVIKRHVQEVSEITNH